MANLVENIRVALRGIMSNLLRAILTMAIIAFGIMALIGMLTALDSIEESFIRNFADLGANTFKIQKKGSDVSYGHGGKGKKTYPDVSYEQGLFFREGYRYPAKVSMKFEPTGSAVLKYQSNETNPKIDVIGSDANFLSTSGLKLAEGRNFTSSELQHGENVVILGNTIKLKLFGYQDPIGKVISIGTRKYRVLGVLEEKGASMGFSGDNTAIIPIKNARMAYSDEDESYTLSVQVEQVQNLSPAINEAIGLFRKIRELRAKDDNDFKIIKSDNLAKMVEDNLSMIRAATFAIGFITLLGAAIGLMNIMLVSVKERTREIGTRKAIGASSRNIRTQFLTEASVISIAGGIVGILLGILIGNAVANYINSAFVIPWFWIAFGFLLCFVVGIAAGYYPANRAAAENPIDALRYE